VGDLNSDLFIYAALSNPTRIREMTPHTPLIY